MKFERTLFVLALKIVLLAFEANCKYIVDDYDATRLMLDGINVGDNVFVSCDFNDFQRFCSVDDAKLVRKNIDTLDLKSNQFIPQKGTFITDISSIYSKTINNRTCQIPFRYNGNLQNTCIYSNNRFQCATDVNSTQFDECSYGGFLSSGPFPDGDSYHAALKIHLGNSTVGVFEAEFYLYSFCNENMCKEAYDYLSVDVIYARNFPDFNQDDEMYEFKIIYTDQIVEKNKWIKMKVPFHVEHRGSKQPIFAMQTGRTFRLNQMNYIAIDNLIIREMKSFGLSMHKIANPIYTLFLAIVLCFHKLLSF